ncbi:enoyl-CoA hydratase/isomerase family protein, partial [bacterium]|nr:enoyl-CoA hydratase/isomerase family protein [bacterium]
LGGGCELAIFCDVIIASDRAKFGQPEIAVGVYPPIAIVHLQSRCSQKFVYDFLLSGSTIKADESLRVGLISKLVPDENFDEELKKYIEGFSCKSSIVLKLTKKALRNSHGLKFDDSLKIVESIYLDELMKTHDANEGLTAFLEKRSPEWENR